ncbi:hypothetical protein [Paenibacillus hamazuiensis]|uniref:hypothetical protein n=1 Tax=Paenibacillus hamazuiensis TaxID=2936508 RepID=UPI00200C7AFE|nr:hypothetical protein [Paenibacillus hamazuiensis]
MKRKIASAVLSAAIACSLSASSFAQEAVNASPNVTDGIFIPAEVGSSWSNTVTSDNTPATATSQFVVPPTYGYVKMRFYNKDSQPVTITIKHESDKEYYSKTIPGGSEDTWRSVPDYPDGVRSGTYTVQYHSAEGQVNVQYSGFASGNKNDLN